MIQSGNDHVNNKKHPQAAFGIALPVFAGKEVGEHEEQRHRESKANQMNWVILQRRREKNISQEHCDAYANRAHIVETMTVETIEEKQRHHYETCDVAKVKHQFGSCLAESEMTDPIEHDGHRQYRGNCRNPYVYQLRFLFKSCFHDILLFE